MQSIQSMAKGRAWMAILTLLLFLSSASVAAENDVSITGLDMNLTGPIGLNQTVTFTVNALPEGNGELYYRFDLIPNYGTDDYDPMNNWQTIQGFSTNDTCTYTFDQTGSYILVAWVSTTASIPADSPQMIGGAIEVADEDSIIFTGLSIDTSWNLLPEDSATFTATATNPNGGEIYYRFDLVPDYGTENYDPVSNWLTMQDFSTSNSCTYTFSRPGAYVVIVWASDMQNIPEGAAPIIGGTLTVSDPGQIIGSGSIVRQVRSVTPFHSLDTRIVADVSITQSGSQSVLIETDDNIVDHLETWVSNGVLIIDSDINYKTQYGVIVSLDMTEIQAIQLSGVGNVTGLNSFTTNDLDLTIAGAGDVTLAGTADTLTAKLLGVGNIDTENLQSRICTILLSGVGDCRVTVTEELSATILGIGNIYYAGDPPIVNSDIIGDGDLIPR